MKPRSPLESHSWPAGLARVRDHAVDRAARELAEAVRGREDAEQARARAERTHDAHQHAVHTARSHEQTVFERGETTAGHRMRVSAWETRVTNERQALFARIEEMRTAEHEAQRGEEMSRLRLAACKADARAVESYRARLQIDEQRAADAREEEALAEAWRHPRAC